MKRLITKNKDVLFIILCLLLAVIIGHRAAFAEPRLVCDDPNPAEQVTGYECFQDGNTLGVLPAPLNYDLDGITPGQYDFTCVAINIWGASQPSDPYVSPTSTTPPLNINMAP